MRRLIPGIVACFVVCLGSHLAADEPDPIRNELTKAKAARAEADAKAKAGLLAAFEEAIKTVAGLGDLDAVKALQAEKKAFVDDGKIPDSTRIRIAASEYQKATKAAQAALEKAYDQAIKDATKALNIDLAEAIQAELKELRGKGPAVPEKGESPTPRATWVSGTYSVYFPGFGPRTYVVRANGEVLEGNVKSTLKHHSGSSFTADFGDEKFERLTFVDGRLFIEHFNPKSNFGKNPPTSLAVGELAKKK